MIDQTYNITSAAIRTREREKKKKKTLEGKEELWDTDQKKSCLRSNEAAKDLIQSPSQFFPSRL